MIPEHSRLLHHPQLQPLRELADGGGVQDVIPESLARLAEPGEGIWLPPEILPRQPRDLLFELGELGRRV